MKPPAKLGKKFTTLSKTFLHSLLGQIVIAFQPTEATMKWDYFLVPIGLNVMYFCKHVSSDCLHGKNIISYL